MGLLQQLVGGGQGSVVSVLLLTNNGSTGRYANTGRHWLRRRGLPITVPFAHYRQQMGG